MTREMGEALERLERAPGWARRECRDQPDLFFAPDGEPQTARAARQAQAIALCHQCPVLEACRDYALGGDGWWEQHGIWGGMTARSREKTRTRVRAKAARAAGPWAPTTEQQQLVLAAVCRWDPGVDEDAICAATGLDPRTVRWQYAAMATLMGLDRQECTYEEWTAAAARTRAVLDLDQVLAAAGRSAMCGVVQVSAPAPLARQETLWGEAA